MKIPLILSLLCLGAAGCAPNGCHRQPGMFGIFSEKYWSGYVCPPTPLIGREGK